MCDQPLDLPPLVLCPGQLHLDMVGDVGDGGGDEELEQEHDVLQDDDQDHGLGRGHVRKHPVDRT